MKRKGNPHKDNPSNTPGEQQDPRGSEVAARGAFYQRQRKLRPLRRAQMLLRKKLLS